MGRLDPIGETNTSGANGGGKWRRELYIKKIMKKSKIFSRKSRRRSRLGRREARRKVGSDRKRTSGKELNIATHSVRTMAVDGKHGGKHEAEILRVYWKIYTLAS